MFNSLLRRRAVERLGPPSPTHLSSLSFQELERITPHARDQRVTAGRRLLLHGSMNQDLVLIASGRGSVHCAGEMVEELGPGDVFGELSERRAGYAVATVRAVTDLCLVVFDSRAVADLREREPGLLDALLGACSLNAVERARLLAGPRGAPTLRVVRSVAAA